MADPLGSDTIVQPPLLGKLLLDPVVEAIKAPTCVAPVTDPEAFTHIVTVAPGAIGFDVLGDDSNVAVIELVPEWQLSQ